MSNRTTSSLLAFGAVEPGRPANSSLRRRFVYGTGAVAVVLLIAAGVVTDRTLGRSLAGGEDQRIADAGTRSQLLIERLLAERRREVDLMASAPAVIEAARAGGDLSRSRGLPGTPVPALEERFRGERSQQVSPTATKYLRAVLPILDGADVIITDQYGFNAVTTAPSADFVQSDESWWQDAWRGSIVPALATEDAATARVVIEMTRSISDGATRVGVVKAKFGLAALDSALMQSAAVGSVRVDVVDSLGRIVASSGEGARLRPFPGFEHLATGGAAPFTYDAAGRAMRASSLPANGGQWRVVAQMDESAAHAGVRGARMALLSVLIVLLGIIIGGLAAINAFIARRLSGPASELATVAESVAEGDLSRDVQQAHGDDEIGRVGRAVSAMIVELRRLAGAMTAAAHDTAAMSAQITAGSEEMAASAGEIAHTAADLSQQSTLMAQTIQLLTASSEQLVQLSESLDSGAQEGVVRNAKLRSLALENRSRLDESSTALEALTTEVQAGAKAVDKLADASAEVKTFVALVQKLARQSKLLALNAAMEAARAGEHGEGFAVVASEVRRLAAMSSEAAERTQQIVADVLKGVDESRASSERAVATVRQVRDTTQHGAHSFAEIETAVAETDGWTASISQTAAAGKTLANELRARLGTLAGGTESFAAAMEQVAASSEEQSASTEEIAAAAATLAGAAERLQTIVANLKLAEGAEPLRLEKRENPWAAVLAATTT